MTIENGEKLKESAKLCFTTNFARFAHCHTFHNLFNIQFGIVFVIDISVHMSSTCISHSHFLTFHLGLFQKVLCGVIGLVGFL